MTMGGHHTRKPWPNQTPRLEFAAGVIIFGGNLILWPAIFCLWWLS